MHVATHTLDVSKRSSFFGDVQYGSRHVLDKSGGQSEVWSAIRDEVLGDLVRPKKQTCGPRLLGIVLFG